MSEQAAGSLSTTTEPPAEPLEANAKQEVSDAAAQEENGSFDEKNDCVPETVSVDPVNRPSETSHEESGRSERGANNEDGDQPKDQRHDYPSIGKSEADVKFEDKDESSTIQPECQPAAGLSKKALKRQKRWENKVAYKKRKKEHQREAKLAKAIFEGRDLEAERKDVEERTKSGEGRARREKKLHDRIHSSADNSFKVCLDCSFEKNMTQKEINSLSSQIRYCYAGNRRSYHPVYLSATSLGGETKNILDKIDGFPEGWAGRGFECHSESMEQVHDKSKLVYLTSDSPNLLEDLENDKVYVIGGIVDRNRLKRATIDRAKELGIATAKLPLTEHLQLFSTRVLTCNHVFEILVKYRDCEKDWKKAMMEVLPRRKLDE